MAPAGAGRKHAGDLVHDRHRLHRRHGRPRAAGAEAGYRRLKVKLGGEGDLERLEAIRAVCDLPLRVDANEGWTPDEARRLLPALVELGVELIEQPFPAGERDAFRELRAIGSGIPLVVDEGCHTLRDVADVATYADGVNLKLAKTGGIREAVRMVHAARALGLVVMLGCMIESSLGISAAGQFASLCDFVDLDGHLLISDDPDRGPRARGRPHRALARRPGLGVEPLGVSERVAVFAEAFLHTSNGKAAHGLIRYGERDVVAVVDSLHAGQTRRRGRAVRRQARARRRDRRRGGGARSAVPRDRRRTGRRQAAGGVEGRAARGARARHARRGRAARRAGARSRAGRRGAARGLELRDLRRVPPGLSTPSGAGLGVPARIVHTVGTDCAIGKMTVTLELAAAALAAGERAVFVPTGQIGISIAGWGIAVDHVIADYVAGAAERLVLEGAERGDLLFVEGQGAVLHPLYSGVTLGLLHGCTPHALVLVHEAGAERIDLEDRGGPPGPRDPAAARAGRPAAAPDRLRCDLRPVVAIALSTRSSPATTRRAPRSRPSSPRPAWFATIRCASAPSASGRPSSSGLA